MSKILFVADIHIYPFTSKNPTVDYRLYQGSRIVSENIIKVGKENNCDIVVFAGDIIDKCIIRPYVQAEVKYFLDKIMSNFKQGFIIWGNHDQDNKSNDQDVVDSVLGVILPPNLYYAHQKSIVIDNTTIAFSNWQPEFDLSWIKSKVDLLVTHARINYDVNNNLFSSQELDESKFDLAICGDIHMPAQLGKFVSIGSAQRCKMGDSEIASGIVFDTADKSWGWVNLNPGDNLIKFKYTSILEDDNKWDPETKTWYSYKREATVDDNGVELPSIPAWEEVNTLIEESIMANNLQDVHSDVVSCAANHNSEEVDFNFTLVRLTCKNWRSIDDCTVYFNEGDRILIQGANGSGKSSLLSALKYAFVDVTDTKGLSSLKPFIRFGTKECYSEVEFLYQGSTCCIRRGTKDYSLTINDQVLKYSDKRSFESDVRQRFPFIKYMDIFFLDAEHNQLIGGMSVEKKSQVISKFLKLDKLDLYNEIALRFLDQVKKSNTVLINSMKEIEHTVNYLTQRVEELRIPNMTREDLQVHINNGLELQRRNKAWIDYVTKNTEYNNKVTQLELLLSQSKIDLDEVNKTLSSLRDDAEIDAEIEQKRSAISELNDSLVNLKSIQANIKQKSFELSNIYSEGSKARLDLNNTKINKICPTCGQVISSEESAKAHRDRITERLNQLTSDYNTVKAELDNYMSIWEKQEDYYVSITAQINEINNSISDLTSIKNNKKELDKKKLILVDKIESYSEELRDLRYEHEDLEVVEKVELPDRFMEIMNDLNYQLKVWDDLDSFNNDIIKNKSEIDRLNNESNNLSIMIDKLETYIKLTGPTGDIYYTILNRLASEFSTNIVRYEVRKYTNRGEHLNLESQYFNNGNWIDYEACSSGQKTILDVNFLNKLVSRLGLLVMDEFLKHLDAENHDICIEMLSSMNIGCVMISSHMESIAAFNNRLCRLNLNEEGLTRIEFN